MCPPHVTVVPQRDGSPATWYNITWEYHREWDDEINRRREKETGRQGIREKRKKDVLKVKRKFGLFWKQNNGLGRDFVTSVWVRSPSKVWPLLHQGFPDHLSTAQYNYGLKTHVQNHSLNQSKSQICAQIPTHSLYYKRLISGPVAIELINQVDMNELHHTMLLKDLAAHFWSAPILPFVYKCNKV